MPNMSRKAFVAGFGIVIFILLFTLIVTPFLFMVIWNALVTYFHHSELKITFWISLLIIILLGIIGSIFRGVKK